MSVVGALSNKTLVQRLILTYTLLRVFLLGLRRLSRLMWMTPSTQGNMKKGMKLLKMTVMIKNNIWWNDN